MPSEKKRLRKVDTTDNSARLCTDGKASSDYLTASKKRSVGPRSRDNNECHSTESIRKGRRV